jgi:hypothetical protein
MISFVEQVGRIARDDREHCFMVVTETQDEYVFVAPSAEECMDWIKDIQVASTVTHSKIVKLAVENGCLMEEKGLLHADDNSGFGELTIFSNTMYVGKTPVTGGMEGWLRTKGVNNRFEDQG